MRFPVHSTARLLSKVLIPTCSKLSLLTLNSHHPFPLHTPPLFSPLLLFR